MTTITLERRVKASPLQRAIAHMREDKNLIGIAALVSTMRVYEWPCGTACTDTTSYVKVDPTFMASLSGTEPEFVVSHEGLHKMQGFFERFEVWYLRYPDHSREHLFGVLNRAGDYLINYWLKHGFKLDMPKGVLYNASCNNMTMTMEQLADKIMAGEGPKNQNPGEGGQGQPQEGDGDGQGDEQGEGSQGSGGMGDGSDVHLPDMYDGSIGNVPSEGELKEHAATNRKDMANAARAAKAAGDTSGFGQMMADESVKDTVNWAQIMYRWASKMRNSGALSFTRPNRRYRTRSGRVQLPSRRTKVLGNVCIVMDTSGSMMGELMNQVMAKTKNVLANVEFDTLYVLHVDCQVKKALSFKKGELHKWTPDIYGGGGTAFAPAFKYMYREMPKVAAVVYHSDGYTGRYDLRECKDLWEKMGRPPVLWAINDMEPEYFGEIAEFGQVMDCR